jgi:hypothetical protein
MNGNFRGHRALIGATEILAKAAMQFGFIPVACDLDIHKMFLYCSRAVRQLNAAPNISSPGSGRPPSGTFRKFCCTCGNVAQTVQLWLWCDLSRNSGAFDGCHIDADARGGGVTGPGLVSGKCS